MSSLKIDRLQLDIIINNDASRKRMLELEDSMKKVRAEMKRLPKDSDEWKKLDAQLKKLQGEFDQLQDSIGLTGLTMNELKAKSRELQMILARLDPRTPQWKQYNEQLQAVKARMAELNGHAKTTAFTFSKMADGFNKYFTMFAAFTASFAGIILGARKAVDEFNKFDDKVADVMKTTGMAKNEVLELDKSLQKIDTRTAQDDLLSLARVAGKLGITGKEDVEGFVNAADKIKVALAEDLGSDVEQAINQVGKLTDIFGLQKEFGIEQAMIKVGSVINSLGAASTANEAYIVEFTKRMAGVAPAANVSADQVMGLAATLDQFGQQAEMSSTAVAAVFTDMFKNPGEYAKIAGMNVKDFNDLLAKDSNEAFIRFLQGLKGNNEGLGEMANKLDALGIEGKRSISVLGVLSNNTDTLRKQQQLANEEFNKGTSLIEEFNIKNNTAQARLEKKKKALALVTRELGEKFAPIMTFSTNVVMKFLKLIGASIDFYRNNAKAINIIVVTLLTYIAATKIATIWQAALNKEGFIYLAYSKLRVFWDNAIRVGTLAATAAQALFTGNLIRARAAMMLLTKTMSINPFVALATVVVAVGYAIYELGKKADATTRFTKAMADVQAEVNKNLAAEQLELTALVKIASDKTKSDEERTKAIKRLNQISPEYLGNLDLEAFKTGKAKSAIDNYLKSLEKKWRLEALESKIKEEMQKAIDIENSSLEDNVKWYNSLWNTIYTGGNVIFTASENQKDALKNKNDELADQISLINSLREEYENLYKVDDKANNGELENNNKTPTQFDINESGGTGKGLFDDIDWLNQGNINRLMDRILGLKQTTTMALFDMADELEAKEADVDAAILEGKRLRADKEWELENDKTAKLQKLYDEGKIGYKQYMTEMTKIALEQYKLLGLSAEQLISTAENVGDTLGALMADMANSSEDAWKNFSKSFMQIMLQTIETVLTSMIAQSMAQPDSVATFGATGVARYVALMALTKAGFAAVKKFTSTLQFADGNLLEVIGASDGRTYKAGWEPFSRNKIYSRPTLLGNKLVGEAGPELVLNAPTTRNLYFNYPELANALRSVYVPQYATGNLNPKPETRNPDYEAAIINMLVKLSKRLDEPIHADVSWLVIKKKSDQYTKITKTSSGN